jgi:hypothetical protein
VLGSAVHRALEAWARHPDEPQGWRQELGLYLREETRLDEEGRERVRGVAEELVGRFLDSELARRIRASREVHAELPFSLPLAGTVLQGSIDLVYRDREHGLVVLDWKTNSPPEEGPLDDWLEAMTERYRTQMLCYALALGRRRDPGAGMSLALHFLRPGLTWRSRVEAPELDAFQARIEVQVERLAARRFRREDALEPVTAARCRRCPYRSVCAERVREAAPPEEPP